MAADQTVVFPNGQRLLYFDDDPKYGKHAYRKQKPDGSPGARVTAVTTAIRPVDFKPDGLMKWAARTNGIGIAELVGEALACEDIEELRSALGWATDYESIWSTLESSGLTYNDVRDRAATRGTNVHELALEALASGAPVPDYEAMTPEERGYARGVVQWWLDAGLSPDLCENVEQIVYSESLGVAGRLDLRVRSPRSERVVIVDLKTGYINEGSHVQLAGYEYCAQECGIGESDAQYILSVKEDGSYDFIPGVAEPADFLAAVDLYRRAGRINREAKKAWAAAHKGGGTDDQSTATPTS